MLMLLNDECLIEDFNVLLQLSFDYVESDYTKMMQSYLAFEERLVAFGLEVIKEMLESVMIIFRKF